MRLFRLRLWLYRRVGFGSPSKLYAELGRQWIASMRAGIVQINSPMSKADVDEVRKAIENASRETPVAPNVIRKALGFPPCPDHLS